MAKSNFHSHTTYCDGKNTVQEMIESAISLNFTSIGFSGHAYTSHDDSWCMTEENTEKYYNELLLLREKYKDRIKVYIGTELDYYSDGKKYPFDYTIGSVHYVKYNDEYLTIDSSAESINRSAARYFNNDVVSFAEKYYELVSDVVDKTNCSFIGHFDLITKFNENDVHFNTKDPRYISAWKKAVDKLVQYNIPFEINTGAMARGKRITPYPSFEIADYIDSKGGFFILTSDCHDASKLDFAFDETEKLYSKYKIVDMASLIK